MTDVFAPIAQNLGRMAAAVVGTEPPAVPIAPPPLDQEGDLASPVAMTLAKAAKKPPREIADAIAARAAEVAPPWLGGIEVAGPGFLNITLSPSWFVEALRQIERDRRNYGGGFADPAESILLEYVSANPTGPPHVGHARHAAYGDSLARMLTFAGHDVTREYYVNDHGRQIEMFARSIIARYAALFEIEVDVPEDGYRGEYVDALAATIRDEVGEGYRDRVADADQQTVAWFADRGVALMLDAIRDELGAFRTGFDAFSSERGLHVGGRVDHCLDALASRGNTYEQDGATWFRTTAFGDEKDRVVVRSDGSSTYLASDVAYHLDKAARGHDRLIDVLGADHHGYVARLKAILAADGHDPDTLEVPIMQLVSLVERGVSKKMSKRAGTLVLLGDLVDDIGVDAARFFLVQRSHDTALELDLDLAREQSQENPVYYVQYAHARVCSILAQADGAGEDGSAPAPSELDPAERALLLRIAGWPDAVSAAVQKRAPHRIAAYSIDLARDLHAFYHRCRVVGEAPEVQAFRLGLVRATRTVLAVALDLLGVDAPERM